MSIAREFQRFVIPVAALSLVTAGTAASRSFAQRGAITAGAPIVGQFMEVRGGVEVRRKSGGGAKLKATSFQTLRADDTVVTQSGGSAVVVLFGTGVRYTLGGGVQGTVTAAGVRPAAASMSVRKLPALPIALLRPLMRPPSLGGGALTGIVRGVGRRGETLRSPRPFGAIRPERNGGVVLAWDGPDNLTQGTVELTVVVKEAAGETVVEEKLPSSARRYVVAPELLQKSREYSWSVVASVNGTEDQQLRSRFRLLTPAELSHADTLIQATKQIRRTDPTDATPELLLAQNFVYLGMLSDAMASYEAAQKRRPDDKAIREKLDILKTEVQNMH